MRIVFPLRRQVPTPMRGYEGYARGSPIVNHLKENMSNTKTIDAISTYS
jgi:hypothetical protein